MSTRAGAHDLTWKRGVCEGSREVRKRLDHCGKSGLELRDEHPHEGGGWKAQERGAEGGGRTSRTAAAPPRVEARRPLRSSLPSPRPSSFQNVTRLWWMVGGCLGHGLREEKGSHLCLQRGPRWHLRLGTRAWAGTAHSRDTEEPVADAATQLRPRHGDGAV